MQDKGIYYSKLIKTFTIIACIVAIILILGLSLLLVNIEQRDSHMLKSSLDAQINQVNRSIIYISETTNRFSTDSTILKWAESVLGTPEYYFYALKIYQMLGDETVFQDYLDIHIGITTPNPSVFIISSPNGTEEKDSIIKNSIEKAPIAIPIFGDDNHLSGLKLITARNVNNTSLIVMGEFKLPIELIDNKYFSIAVLDNATGNIYSSNDDFLSSISRTNINNKEFKRGKYACYQYTYQDYGFSLIYGIRRNIQYLSIAILILLFIVLILAFIFILSRITRNLYKPVGDVMKELSDGNTDGQDEFAIIKDNCRKIEYLYSELEQAMNEQDNIKDCPDCYIPPLFHIGSSCMWYGCELSIS